ncbi:lipoyl(octanoyl) transferase LipB [uncultured Nevskia sp.]|uniref:lipoyl(octanoyl) transferase LipB n=1 Tax=uncultured Nevskia sp. TaxID=228950 RepID=UPI0025FAA18E|nr:lipoyl(octanoyl) transferase LipB [uncultured Nevskia sp.]
MNTIVVRSLGRRDYGSVYDEMRAFTAARTAETLDELWLVEHPPVFTQGQAGKPEHLLNPGDIPVVQSNRGGQVTYHGPGQVVIYVLVDIARRGYGIRSLVTRLENAMIATLARYGITAAARADAPGVYVSGLFDDGLGPRSSSRKIGSLGLRISRGCSYHGLSLNVAMDLAPFARINPCGLLDMRMTQVSELGGPADCSRVETDLIAALRAQL